MSKYLVLLNYGEYEGWTRELFDNIPDAVEYYKQNNISGVLDAEIYEVKPLELTLKGKNDEE